MVAVAARSRSVNFFRATVEPTVDEFVAHPLEIRRGRLATIVLFHMADYWFLEHKAVYGKLQKLCGELALRCPDFIVIRDAANASKHDRLTQSAAPARVMSSSDQIDRTAGIFQAPFGTAMFGEASIVMFTLDDGTSRPLIGAVRSVLLMWQGLIS